MKTGIIILAAGSSSRFGKPKQLVNFNGKKLLQHIADAASQSKADFVVIVLGANAELISNEISLKEKAHFVLNDEWSEGLSSSIKTGLRFLREIDATIDCAIITVCDQPYINSGLFDELIYAYQQTNKLIIGSSYADTIGTPVLFNQKYFPELLQLHGDAGAKRIVMNHQDEVALISFKFGNIDIDTEEDYKSLNESV